MKETIVADLGLLLAEARRRAHAEQAALAPLVAGLAGCSLEALVQLAPVQLDVAFYVEDALLLQAAVFDVLSFTDCLQRQIFPARIDGRLLYVVNDPWEEETLQWILHRTGGYPTMAWGTPDGIVQALQSSRERLRASTDLPAAAAAPTGRPAPHMISLESIERSHSPVVRFVDAVIYDAWKAGASDIHLECDRTGVRAKLRLDGVLSNGPGLPGKEVAEEVISRVKVLAQLDIAERRVPQDGRFQMHLEGRDLDFRVSVMPSIHGEDAVVRLLDKSHLRGEDQHISLASLGLDADAVARIRELAKRPHGMLLVTGPTGSGKTTTLYAALSEIHTGQEKIVTIEDPVEYELAGVLQIPVNEKKGLTFSQGLRSILRHDPDKILVGEIRDGETAEIAVQAALTGHLVFTTVHANSVYDVINRFVHMDLDLHSLVSALNGVVAQRLIRRNCPHCSQAAMSAELDSRLSQVLGQSVVAKPMRGRGCEHCRQTGYKGRYAIAEVLPLDDELRGLILQRSNVSEIKRKAASLGVRPLLVRALDLVVAGATTLEEVDRVVAHD
jgi:general secretion pathway protein E